MSLQPNKEPTGQEPIPDILVDPGTKRRYQRGKFLGKGGFAKCYELVDMDTRTIYAGKIVSKGLLTKQHQKDKMAQEISIHRALLHAHIVGFHSFFEDKNFVFIVLELCSKRSLMELHKRRKALTEPEARYFLRHILLGVQFLHNQKIIHRDLKLGNLFLNDNMEVKVGDFGLATRVEFDGERKRTLCGTPNYIAPEVLNKKGHSYEVDIWSIGCILYTLLVGRPPFETQTLKDTYSRIKKNEYTVPSRVGPSAKNIIVKMLQSEPARRPNVEQVLHDEFMTGGYLPSRLPLSCLTTSPRFDTKNNVSLVAGTTRKPLVDLNAKEGNPQIALKKEVGLKNPADGPKDAASAGSSNSNNLLAEPDKMFQYYLKDLERQLRSFLSNQPQTQAGTLANMDEAEDPAAVPMVWVSKWVDYSDKYGFGYQLCDDSIGVIFNDMTKLLLLTDGKNIHYIERGGSEQYYTLQDYPGTLEKKVKLLSYFRHYMNEHLLKAGASITPREGDELSRIPCVRQWFRTSRAVVMHFSNGTLQINFFNDHTKIVLCPLMGAVTYIDMEKNFRTYRFSLLQEHGCSDELATRLRYALEKVAFLLSCKSGGSLRPKLLS